MQSYIHFLYLYHRVAYILGVVVLSPLLWQTVVAITSNGEWFEHVPSSEQSRTPEPETSSLNPKPNKPQTESSTMDVLFLCIPVFSSRKRRSLEALNLWFLKRAHQGGTWKAGFLGVPYYSYSTMNPQTLF